MAPGKRGARNRAWFKYIAVARNRDPGRVNQNGQRREQHDSWQRVGILAIVQWACLPLGGFRGLSDAVPTGIIFPDCLLVFHTVLLFF